MNNTKQKLELTWIGKGQEPKLEPRILIEDPSKSYGDPKSENMLIHGDNLLALKALEQEFAGKIKCIYIDPPYNTGSAFEYYDDNLEHSIWLNLIRPRIEILHKLLSDNGAILVHIDDNEQAYLKIIMDEVFGRSNFINCIAVRDSHPSGLKLAAKDKKIIKTKSYILIYKKSDLTTINPIYQPREEWDTHYSIYMDPNSKPYQKKPLREVLIKMNIINTKDTIDNTILKNTKFKEFCFENRTKIFQSTKEMPDDIRQLSRDSQDKIIDYVSNGEINYALNGRRLFPLSKSIYNVGVDGEYKEDFAKLLCDFWDDVDFNNSQNEGGVTFPASKKPEYLVARLITMFSHKGDFVLDSFLGSGTTSAVAHKMSRKWIGIELGDHANTHCLSRLKHIVDGTDLSGITNKVNWKGGEGFKFFNLAPSLLKKDKLGNWTIAEKYNPNMLAAAMCKHMGFKYLPHSETYWKQGQSTETDFIYTTTNFLTVELLDIIKEEMKPEETLLICSKSYDPVCEDKYKYITIKKIPQSILGKCEFSKDNYDLNIIKHTEEIAEEQEEIQD